MSRSETGLKRDSPDLTVQARPGRLSPPRLLAISDFCSGGGAPREAPLEAWVDSLAAAGVEAAQVREKSLSDRDLLALCCRAVEAAAGRLRILVNGRPDIALASGAEGVHLPSRGWSPTDVRHRWPGLLLGLSTHDVGEIEAAAGTVDYVTFGPVYATPSKARYGEPAGLEALTTACRPGVPVLALGGISSERLAQVAASGAWGAAAIRALQETRSLVEMARQADRVWPRD